jgi:dihydroorotate dehydrogenase (fumarate)
MDLSTTYLGFKLPHPLMPGASPLVDDLDTVRRLEDAGAAAIVMHSLFEEQITYEALGREAAIDMHEESFAEAMSYFPRPEDYRLGPDQYRAAAQDQGGGQGAGDRIAQRHQRGRLARLREADG